MCALVSSPDYKLIATLVDDDGFLHVRDRKSLVIIRGGANVYPAEVECLLNGHPSVAAAAVIGVADERMGEVGKAFIVLRAGSAADQGELTVWSRANMANYKVPHSFVIVPDLPRNAAGKVLKTELRD